MIINGLKIIYEINIRGAIFCHVIKINAFSQERPSITLGNQKWNGAEPLFNRREEKIIISIKKLELILFEFNKNKIVANRNTEEASACVRKYFNEASVDINLLSLIRGIKDNKLISKPIQAPNQELAEIEISVPIIKIRKNTIFDELLKIKKKRIRTFISGVWAQ